MESITGSHIEVDEGDLPLEEMMKQTFKMMKDMKTSMDQLKIEVGMATSSAENANNEVQRHTDDDPYTTGKGREHREGDG